MPDRYTEFSHNTSHFDQGSPCPLSGESLNNNIVSDNLLFSFSDHFNTGVRKLFFFVQVETQRRIHGTYVDIHIV